MPFSQLIGDLGTVFMLLLWLLNANAKAPLPYASGWRKESPDTKRMREYMKPLFK